MSKFQHMFRLLCLTVGVIFLGEAASSFRTSLEGYSAVPASLSQQAEPDEPTGSEPFQLSVPRLRIQRLVLPEHTKQNLKRAAVWLPQTARPGEIGNSVIAAHRDTHFRFLRHLRRGDELSITRGRWSYPYRVESITIVDPENNQLLAGTNNRQLTLVTCYPFFFAGPAPRRYVVTAIASGPGYQKSSD